MKRKMKTSSKVVLIVLGVIVLGIVILFNWNNILYLVLPAYEYKSNGYVTGSTIEIQGVIFEEIDQDSYDELLQEWPLNQGSYRHAIGKTIYDNGAVSGKYIVYGTDIEGRVLLKGESIVIVNDNVYPVVYFCRKDILNEYKATQEDQRFNK